MFRRRLAPSPTSTGHHPFPGTPVVVVDGNSSDPPWCSRYDEKGSVEDVRSTGPQLRRSTVPADLPSSSVGVPPRSSICPSGVDRSSTSLVVSRGPLYAGSWSETHGVARRNGTERSDPWARTSGILRSRVPSQMDRSSEGGRSSGTYHGSLHGPVPQWSLSDLPGGLSRRCPTGDEESRVLSLGLVS